MAKSQVSKSIKPVDNRRPDGKFGPGNNANPAGRPKGQSLKEFWRQRLAEMTAEEKLSFTTGVAADVIWRMSEGNPKQDTDITSGGQELSALTIVKDGKDAV